MAVAPQFQHEHAAANARNERVAALLGEAGIEIGGNAPWDIQVHDDGVYSDWLARGSLALGETYMDGQWDVASLDELFVRLLRARLDEHAPGLPVLFDALRARWQRRPSPRRSREVGRRHYDLGDAMYRAMLGPGMMYSCGYWRHAKDLDEAQEAKLDLVCRKLGLRAGQRVLDIGCGWGGALKFAAERYGVQGVGVTISERQADYARNLCRGLPIEIRLQDYRELDERFDHAFSIGMFEHVGADNYRGYFETVRRCLSAEGLFVLHCIGRDYPGPRTDPWIARYIFPNSMLPAPAQVTTALERLFVIEDWHNFGADYDLTLQAWRSNFETAWPRLRKDYDERFRRMWLYYLGQSMAAFRTRRAQLWQLVLSPGGVPGGYVAPR